MISRTRMGHYLAGLGLSIFAIYAFLVWPGSGQAITSSVIGEVGVSVVPVGTVADGEYLDLEFPTMTTGAALEVTGWTIAVDGEAVATVPTSTIIANDSMRLCSLTSPILPNCEPVWVGEVFPDEGGTVTVLDGEGQLVATVSYGATGMSEVVRETFSWSEPLYSARDRVTYCSTRDGVKYRETKEQALKVVEGIKGRAVIDATAIVPPFYHRLDTTMAYYPGQNWTTTNAAFHANGCQ